MGGGGAALSSGGGGRTSDGRHKELRPVAGGAPVGCDGRRLRMLTEIDQTEMFFLCNQWQWWVISSNSTSSTK